MSIFIYDCRVDKTGQDASVEVCQFLNDEIRYRL